MRAVDEVILGVLVAGNVDIHDTEMVIPGDDDPGGDGDPKVVTYDLPYAVYHSNVGDDDRPRLTGRRARRSVFFTITYVGIDRNQAKALGERIRSLLQDKPIAVPDRQTWLCQLLESQRVRADHEVVRPDGSSLFYGVDNYQLPITITH